MSRIGSESIIAQVTEIAARVGSAEGIEVVEVEFLGGGKNRLLRIYIDKPGGVSHADCEFMSQQVGAVLDVEDVVPGSGYTLEVSSPGVERKLVKPGDYERFAGQKIKVLLREPVDNQRRWEGTLVALSEGVVTLESAPGKQIRFPLERVERANLKFEW